MKISIPDFTIEMPKPFFSINPVTLLAPGRSRNLEVRVSAPSIGNNLPIIVFAHGFGNSSEGYAPLVNYWASRGFVVIQPTFLDSTRLLENPATSHGEAVKAYLKNPLKFSMWKYRVDDVKHILNQLDLIEDSIPGRKGRLDRTRIVIAGHSFGAQTAAMLLGARVLDADGKPGDDHSDPRIKAGILLSAAGSGGNALSEFALEHFPHLNGSYDKLRTPTLVVAGDHDQSPLTTVGPGWFTEAFKLSPGANALLTLFGGEHMLGGISGYLVTETTDENSQRVAAVQELTWAYMRSQLYPEDPAWANVSNKFNHQSNAVGRVDIK